MGDWAVGIALALAGGPFLASFMKALASPLVSSLLASLLSAAVVLGWLWKTTLQAAADIRNRHVEAKEATRPEKPWDFWTSEIENLARELEAARAELAKRETELVGREKRVAEEASELERTRAQIEAMRGDINRQLIEVKETEKKNLKPLAATYSQIAPAAAAAILAKMDDLTVAKLLSLMKADVNSAILAQLANISSAGEDGAKRAADISLLLKRISAERATGGS